MKKFKLISLAAAGVVAATAITASAVGFPKNEEVRLTEFEEQLLCGIYPEKTLSAEEQAQAEHHWITAKLLKEGVIDRASPDADIIGEDGLTDLDRVTYNTVTGTAPAPVSADELYRNELYAIFEAERNQVIKLTKEATDPYVIWRGIFTVDNLAETTLNFSEPAYFSIKISDGKKATIISAPNYTRRYKSVTVYATYQSGNDIIQQKATTKGEGKELIANPSAVKGAKLVETTAYFYVYDGDNSLTDITECAFVHIVDSEYAKSAQYAENSYASLIDQYIHIEN